MVRGLILHFLLRTCRANLQEARPKERWLGVWNASAPGSKCIQYDHPGYSIQGDEDCLYVNVYTPTVSGQVITLLLLLPYRDRL